MKLSVQQRISPRIAGTAAVLVGLSAAVASGFLIAHPPFSIPGAVLLVLATILICVGAIWRLKRTWADPWPPYTPPSRRKMLRRLRVMFIFSCVAIPVLLVGVVYAAAHGWWWDMAFCLLFTATPAMNVVIFSRQIKILRDQPDEAPGT